MLNKQDKKEIEDIFENSLEKFSRDVLKPVFDNLVTKDELNKILDEKLDEKLDKILDEKLDEKLKNRPTIEQMNYRFDRLEQKILEQVTAPSIKRDLKLNFKTNQAAEKLAKKKIFSSKDFREIKNIAPVVNPAS